jgi:hypothetical protein
VALYEFGAPLFPIFQKRMKLRDCFGFAVPAKQSGGRGGRTGAGIQLNHSRFPPGE